MLDQKSEYILWLTKRLVYKYNEDPQIINEVENILNENQSKLSFYRDSHELINKSLKASIHNLSEIYSEYSLKIQNKETQYSKKSIEIKNEIFQDLDLNELFR